jgi:predicted mannosyl-3-phosphoglycerate phosphatase (HAD superfamily)
MPFLNNKIHTVVVRCPWKTEAEGEQYKSMISLQPENFVPER